MYLIYSAMIGPFTGQTFQLCLTSLRKADIAPFHSSTILSLFLFHPVSHHAHAHTHTHRRASSLTFSSTASFSGQSSACGRGGVILRSQPSVQICLRAQRDFLIRVTNTNAFKFPQPRLLTSLIPCNALFTSSSAQPQPPTSPSLNHLASGEGQPHTTSLAENPYSLDVFASSGQLIEPRAGSIFSHNCS